MSFEEWQKQYWTKEIIDLNLELDEKDIEILSKLKIIVKEKIYTECEYECLMSRYGAYYKDDMMSKIDFMYVEPLEKTGVSKEEYMSLSKKLDMIYNKYSKYFPKFKLV